MHVSVLLQEMLEIIRPTTGCIYLDGTLGAGGYSEAILEASAPDGSVVAFDLDPDALNRASERLKKYGKRFAPVHGGFHHATDLLASLGIGSLDGAVLDLGLSSDQLEDDSRGFSFRYEGPLDMRFDTTSGLTATDYLGRISARQLEETLATYGEERYCKKLARGLIRERDRGRLTTTQELALAVTRIIGPRRGRIHPATRTFQALRIAVNKEMESLATALEEIPLLLKPGGRFCVVSYHSLEDRQVKQSFRQRQKTSHAWNVVTPRPIRPTTEELKANPRARSAKMRALEALEIAEDRRADR